MKKRARFKTDRGGRGAGPYAWTFLKRIWQMLPIGGHFLSFDVQQTKMHFSTRDDAPPKRFKGERKNLGAINESKKLKLLKLVFKYS